MMGEAPPYTQNELSKLVDNAFVKGIHRYDDNSVVLVLEKNGRRIEFEVWANYIPDGESEFSLTVYLRGAED